VDQAIIDEIKSENEQFIDAVQVLNDSEDPIGYAIRTLTPVKGYGGDIEMFVGFSEAHEISGIKILSFSETPGLGTKIEESSFVNQFVGQLADKVFSIGSGSTEDGEVTAVSGATISSAAFISGVNNAVTIYDAYFNESSSGGLTEEPDEGDLASMLVPGAKELVLAEEDLLNAISEENDQFVTLEGAYDGNDELIGFAIKTWSTVEGYYGHMELYIGMDLDGAITGIQITEINETPGLGTNVEREDFQEQFKGKTGIDTFVISPGGTSDDEVSAVAGATISSRSFISAINNAVSIYNDYIR